MSQRIRAPLQILLILFFMISLVGCGDILPNPFQEVRTVRSKPDLPPEKPTEVPLNCMSECKIGEETANCLVLNKRVSRPEYMNRVMQVPKLFEDNGPNSKIAHSDLMRLFDNPSDPCGRSGIDIGPNFSFSNFSDTYCTVIYSFALGELSLIIPKTIQGKYSRKESGYELAFQKKRTRLELRFSNEKLHSDYGGKIINISIVGPRTIVKTTSACIAARL